MDSDPQQTAAIPETATRPPEPRPRTRRRIFTARSLLLVFLCGLLAYAAFVFLSQAPGPATAPEAVTVQPTPTRQPTPEGQPTPTGQPTPAPTPAPVPTALPAAPAPAGPAASPPQRLIYPAADMDVVIHPLEPNSADRATQTIVPPPTMDGYWLTPYGVPGAGSTNTTYVAGHDWVDRDAPFNRLSKKAAVGDKLSVATATGQLAYRVDTVTTYDKSGLKDSPIWQVAPNRLVLISCYTDDPWGTNVVVVASPDPEVPVR